MSKDKLKSDRSYLLSITPSSLCKEFRDNSPSAYQLLVQGLIGVSDMESILKNKHLKNNIEVCNVEDSVDEFDISSSESDS